jgi:hypothetical protein
MTGTPVMDERCGLRTTAEVMNAPTPCALGARTCRRILEGAFIAATQAKSTTWTADVDGSRIDLTSGKHGGKMMAAKIVCRSSKCKRRQFMRLVQISEITDNGRYR